MAHQGRGSVVIIIAAMVLCFLVLHDAGVAQAATYSVTWNMKPSIQRQNFRAGDTLVFKYTKRAHNVVAVSRDVYENCKTPPKNAKTYTIGNDQIKLVKGWNYFICSLPGHCQANMKIAVQAN